MARTSDQEPVESALPARWIRGTGVALLTVFLVFGLVGLEAWPVTGWHLFSTRRSPVESSWQAYAVDPAGDEQRVEWLDLPVAYRQGYRLLSSLPHIDPDDAAERCEGLVTAVREGYPDLVAVEVYKVEDELGTDGERTERSREHRFSCPAEAP